MRRPTILGLAPGSLLAALLLAAPDASAFTPAGHKVLEVMAYREMGAGGVADAAVLATLMRDGAIVPAQCFGSTTSDCNDRREQDPLAWWPAPHTDIPDAVLARQFNETGQCFHFMAQREDESTTHWVDPRNPRDPHVSYGLMWDAYYRCVNQLEWILQRTLDDPMAARDGAHGMYELMHAVMDSYSKAHTDRDYEAWTAGASRDPAIRFLKVWQPTVGNPFADATRNTRHEIFETRDDDFVERFLVVDGRPCTDYVARPYSVPPACLSLTGRLAVDALKDVMRLVVDLRARGASTTDARAAWLAFVDRHMPHAATFPPDPTHPPPAREHETVPFLFLGTRAELVPRTRATDSTIVARYLVTSGAIDPLALAVSVEAGTRHVFSEGSTAFFLRQDVDVMLPLGSNIWLGATPFSFGYAAPSESAAHFQSVSRAVRLDWFQPFGLSRIALSLWGPGEYSWLDEQLEWSFGLGVSGGLLENAPGAFHRRACSAPKQPLADHATWEAPAPWDSELRSGAGPVLLGPYLGATSGGEGLVSSGGGKIREGVELDFLKRNWWGELNPVSLGVLLEDVVEFTSTSTPHTSLSAYGTGRLYFSKPFGLLVDLGVNTEDLSPAHLHPWSLQARGGLVFSVGKLDFIVESPTVPRFSFVAGELLSARLGLETIAF